VYLLDTNIVSAGAPTKKEAGTQAFAEWLHRENDRLYMSSVTIAEVEAGIARAERMGAFTKVARLRKWLSAVEHLYGGRILPFGILEARQAGAILDRARAHNPGFEDIAIAATAAARGFTVLTANERHFLPLGVPYLNPFDQMPGNEPSA
jgi:predicted nucleic acid-binding protein